MRPLPEKLDLALVTRLRQVVAGEVATESELRALADEAVGWVRATEAHLHAAERRLTELNADPASPLAGIATEVRRVEALSRELQEARRLIDGLERRTREPLADIRALAAPPVLLTNMTTLLVGFGMFGSFILIPTLAESPTSTGYGFGVDATHAGLLLLPGSLAMLALGPLSGIVGSRVGNKVPLAIGGSATALGLALLAVAHGSQGEVIGFSVLMSGGIGFAYAAMPNLIIDAVPPQQTGEATGFNALVRSVGSSLGSQVAATVLAASAVAGVSTDAGFTHAFAISAAVAACAGLAAIAIPRTPTHAHVPALDEIGSALPLADPAYAAEEF